MEASRSYLLLLTLPNILMHLYLCRILSQKCQRTTAQCLFLLHLAVTRRPFLLELVTPSFGRYTAQLVMSTTMCVEHMAQVLFLLGFWRFQKENHNLSAIPSSTDVCLCS